MTTKALNLLLVRPCIDSKRSKGNVLLHNEYDYGTC